jgi:hypothetical protein
MPACKTRTIVVELVDGVVTALRQLRQAAFGAQGSEGLSVEFFYSYRVFAVGARSAAFYSVVPTWFF